MLLAVAVLLLACDKKEAPVLNDEGCYYSYSGDSTELKWTAFKFTEKVGVGGTFDSVTVTGTRKAGDPLEVIRSLAFAIDTKSVNSANEQRDERISRLFFQPLETGASITGSVESLKETGEGSLRIKMNGVERSVPVHYKVMKGEEIELWGELNVNDWKAEESLSALNQECHDLHTGKDGVSKLWPQVEFRAYTRLQRTCP